LDEHIASIFTTLITDALHILEQRSKLAKLQVGAEPQVRELKAFNTATNFY